MPYTSVQLGALCLCTSPCVTMGGVVLLSSYLLFSLLRASFSFESLASCLGWEVGGFVQERLAVDGLIAVVLCFAYC